VYRNAARPWSAAVLRRHGPAPYPNPPLIAGRPKDEKPQEFAIAESYDSMILVVRGSVLSAAVSRRFGGALAAAMGFALSSSVPRGTAAPPKPGGVSIHLQLRDSVMTTHNLTALPLPGTAPARPSSRALHPFLH
jgi:hypothetical protein